MIPQVYIVGSDKGGVGKTTISRVLVDYFKKNCRAVDTEDKVPGGVLKRFFPDQTELVDLEHTDGQMQVFDALKNSPVTIIDIKAGLLTPTLRTLAEIGFLDKVRAGSLRIGVLHVLDGSVTSLAEIQPTTDALQGASHYLVRNNRADDLKWTVANGVDVPRLATRAAARVDELSSGFADFVANEAESETLRGLVRTWMGRVSANLETAGIGRA